jgi:ribonuclease HI
MPRLTDFPGFSIGSSKEISGSKDVFNPFEDFIPLTKKPIQEFIPQLPIIPAIEQIAPCKLPLAPNILDAPADAPEEPVIALFPQSPVKPVEESEADIPMIQPRSKEGQRLLYKFPLCPKIRVKDGFYYLMVGSSDRSAQAYLLQFDGAANPNPGPASSGAVLWSPKDMDGKRTVLFESGKFLGKATNNIAEVQGLLLGLQIAVLRGARELLIEGDSELIVFQQIGKYKVSDKNLKVWWAQIQAAMMDEISFDWIAIRQVPREQNERADSITKEVLSKKQSFQRA